jgi:gliding motility-associated-like protein
MERRRFIFLFNLLFLFVPYQLQAQLVWQNQISGTGEFLFDIDFVSPDVGCAVGEGGVVFRTDNGGLNWSPQTSSVSHRLKSVHFHDTNRGWIAGWGGSILKTTNGGSSWSLQSFGSAILFEDLFFLDENQGWAVGEDTVADNGVVYKTTNGGNSWDLVSTVGWNSLGSVDFVSADIGFATGGWELYKTTDGGNSWFSLTVPTTDQVNRVNMANASVGWLICGNGEIYKTTNGASSWIPQSASTTSLLWGIEILDEMNVFIAGHGGTILKTNNGGTTWVQQAGTFTSLLVGVSAIDPFTVWVCGENGKIYSTLGQSDLEIIEFLGPDTVCIQQPLPLLVKIRNNGNSTVFNGNFAVLNSSVPVAALNWIGPLVPGQEMELNLGTITIEDQANLMVTFNGDDVATNNIFYTTIELASSVAFGVNGPFTVCAGETVNMFAWGGQSYHWLNATPDSSLQLQHIIVYNSTDFVVEIKQASCIVKDTVSVTVQDGDCGTTAFSPNNDGINDFFYIDYLPPGNNVVTIYNRWGDEIAVIYDYDNISVYWQGDDSNNNTVPEGTYYYVVDADTDGAQLKGWVQVLP